MTPDEDDSRGHMVSSGHMIRADLVAGLVFVILGVVIIYLAWTMPRLELRRVHPATVPGLVPGMLGIALTICGAVLASRSLPSLREPAGWRRFGRLLVSVEARRAGVVAILGLIYALGLVGTLPFWLATFTFVFAFILIFECALSEQPRPLVRTAVTAGIQALVLAAAVEAVFRYGFLVRLP